MYWLIYLGTALGAVPSLLLFPSVLPRVLTWVMKMRRMTEPFSTCDSLSLARLQPLDSYPLLGRCLALLQQLEHLMHRKVRLAGACWRHDMHVLLALALLERLPPASELVLRLCVVSWCLQDEM